MKRKLLLLLGVSLLLFAFNTTSTVYICDSNSAKAYHRNKECNALKKCNHGIKPMSEIQAIELGKKLCGFEH